jgi:hypothetical protein
VHAHDTLTAGKETDDDVSHRRGKRKNSRKLSLDRRARITLPYAKGAPLADPLRTAKRNILKWLRSAEDPREDCSNELKQHPDLTRTVRQPVAVNRSRAHHPVRRRPQDGRARLPGVARPVLPGQRGEQHSGGCECDRKGLGCLPACPACRCSHLFVFFRTMLMCSYIRCSFLFPFQGVRMGYGHGIVGHVALTRRSLHINAWRC